MSTVTGLFAKWRQKRSFVHLAQTMEPRLMADVGFPPDVVREKLNTPFWRFQ